MKKFVLYTLPVVLWMGMIFRLSGVPADDLPPMPSDFWLFWAHKATHLVEYTVLGFLSRRAAGQYARHWPHSRTAWGVGLLVMAFALSDEWHQSFTPGRTPSLIDVSLDTVYGGIGIVLYQILGLRHKNV